MDQALSATGAEFECLLPKLFDAFAHECGGPGTLSAPPGQLKILVIAAAATVAQIDTQGDEALVTLIDPKTKDTFQFNMRRQPNHGTWQIVSVNYDDLKRFSKREFLH
jgi:hypothetical protein